MISKINVAHTNTHGVKARPEAVVPAQLENVKSLFLASLKIKNKEKQKLSRFGDLGNL